LVKLAFDDKIRIWWKNQDKLESQDLVVKLKLTGKSRFSDEIRI
jgi:hypothetical protein